MPVTYFAKMLGSYLFVDQTARLDEQLAFREQSTTVAGVGGRNSGDTLFDGLFLTLSGIVLATDIAGGNPNNPADIRTAWDKIKGALIYSGSMPLFIDTDRFVNVRLASEFRGEGWNGLPVRDFSVTLVSREDPPWWSQTPTTVAGLAAGVNIVSTVGNGPSDPVISVPVSAVGGTFSVSNGTTSFQITPDAVGTYLIDTKNESVTESGLDKMYLLTGDFFRLAPGDNTLTFSDAGGYVFSAWSVTWSDRWY